MAETLFRNAVSFSKRVWNRLRESKMQGLQTVKEIRFEEGLAKRLSLQMYIPAFSTQFRWYSVCA